MIALNFLCILLFWASPKWLYLWNRMLNLYGRVSVWFISRIEAYTENENWVFIFFRVQTHFAWSHHKYQCTYDDYGNNYIYRLLFSHLDIFQYNKRAISFNRKYSKYQPACMWWLLIEIGVLPSVTRGHPGTKSEVHR